MRGAVREDDYLAGRIAVGCEAEPRIVSGRRLLDDNDYHAACRIEGKRWVHPVAIPLLAGVTDL